MRGRRVAVIGLGLMGGSLARDLAAAGATVLGGDAQQERAERALADGVITAVLDDSLSGVRDVDIVVIATPVDATLAILDRLAPVLGERTVVTDVGSTKSTVIAHAVRAGLGRRFVGSHPMAGSHRSGWDASQTGLYGGARVLLCPTPETAPEVVALVASLWTQVGARHELLDAAEHDARLAWSSHLPQVASSAVAAALADAGARPEQMGPGGRDVTRLAASSPAIWVAICLANEADMLRAVRALRGQLGVFETALAAKDTEALRRFFEAGREWLK